MRFFLVALVGCGGQSGDEGMPTLDCGDISRVDVPLDEVAEGFTATPEHVIADTTGTWSGTLTPESGPSWEAELTVTPDGTASLRQASSDRCLDYYVIPAQVRLIVGDGDLLDLVLDVEFSDSTHEHEPSFGTTVPMADIVGSVTPPWSEGRCDDVALLVSGEWEDPDEITRVKGYVEWECAAAHTPMEYALLGELGLASTP